MALRDIVLEGDDILTKKCRPVKKFDDKLATLLDDMAQTLHTADGVGLAAPQVGILRRVCRIDVGEPEENKNSKSKSTPANKPAEAQSSDMADNHSTTLVELINPEIISSKGEQDGAEGCLSCPNEYGVVKRPMYVTVKAQDRYGNEFTVSGEGLKARAFCHEIDHLNGIMFKSKVSRMLAPDEIEHK